MEMKPEFPAVLKVNQRARKVGGSFQALGTVVSAFKTLGGEQRYVFEFVVPKGMLHIYGPSQLVADIVPPPTRPMSGDGDLFTVDEWREHVRLGMFVPSDGCGYWANATHEGEEDAFMPQPDWATHVSWYNN